MPLQIENFLVSSMSVKPKSVGDVPQSLFGAKSPTALSTTSDFCLTPMLDKS